MNNHGEAENGKYASCLVTTLKYVIDTGPAFFVSENVKGALALIRESLDGVYVVYGIDGCPSDSGYGCNRRDREFVVGVHRGHGQWLQDPSAVYKKITKELSARQVPQSEAWWMMNSHDLRFECEQYGGKKNEQEGDFFKALSDAELARMNDCYAEWESRYGTNPKTDPQAVFDFKQSAERLTSSRADGAFPAFLENWGRLWSPTRGRWLSAAEKFAIMGWPTRPDLATALKVQMVQVACLRRAHASIGSLGGKRGQGGGDEAGKGEGVVQLCGPDVLSHAVGEGAQSPSPRATGPANAKTCKMKRRREGRCCEETPGGSSI